MDPILRRSVIYYLTHFVIWFGMLSRFLIVGDWPTFEIIPLFVPAWLASSLLFSEREESYAFLRTLPVADRAIVRTKLGLILSVGALYWVLMTVAAFARGLGSATGPAVFVYVGLVAAIGLLIAAGFQVLIWRFGITVMTGVIVVYTGVVLIATLVHTASMRFTPGWSEVTRMRGVVWLAGAPWLTHPVLVGLTLLAFYGLVQAGIRVKASSEACL